MSKTVINLPVLVQHRSSTEEPWRAQLVHIRLLVSSIGYVSDPDWMRPHVWHNHPDIEWLETMAVMQEENYRIASYVRLVTGEVFISGRTNEEIVSMIEDAE